MEGVGGEREGVKKRKRAKERYGEKEKEKKETEREGKGGNGGKEINLAKRELTEQHETVYLSLFSYSIHWCIVAKSTKQTSKMNGMPGQKWQWQYAMQCIGFLLPFQIKTMLYMSVFERWPKIKARVVWHTLICIKCNKKQNTTFPYAYGFWI